MNYTQFLIKQTKEMKKIITTCNNMTTKYRLIPFYPRDAMLAWVFATATCLSVRPSVCPDIRPSHASIVPSRAKAGS